MTAVASPLSGRVVPLDEVADPVFAGRVMGDGVAVIPDDGAVLAPVAGTIEKLFPGGHAIALQTASGVQVLVHVGLDTVHLHGEGFAVHTAEGDRVEAGALLVTLDLDRLRAIGVDLTSPVVVISGEPLDVVAAGTVRAGDPLLQVAD